MRLHSHKVVPNTCTADCSVAHIRPCKNITRAAFFMKVGTNGMQSGGIASQPKGAAGRSGARRCLMFHSPSADTFALRTRAEWLQTLHGVQRRKGSRDEYEDKTWRGRQKLVGFSRRREMCFLRKKRGGREANEEAGKGRYKEKLRVREKTQCL